MAEAARSANQAALPDHLEAQHRRFVTVETVIGSTMTGLLPAAVIWLVRAPLPLPVLGNPSLASSLILATLLPGFGMPVILTLVVRNRVRRGTAPALGWPLRRPGLARFLPRPVLLRGVLAAAAALFFVVPAGLLLLLALGVARVSATGFILYNFVHGIALGALVLPPVVTRALADGADDRMTVASVAQRLRN